MARTDVLARESWCDHCGLPVPAARIAADGSWALDCHFGGGDTGKGLRFTVRVRLNDAEGTTVATKDLRVTRR